MHDPAREQRITLRVQDTKLALRVRVTEEAHYRRATEDLNHTYGLFRQRYILPEATAHTTCLTMAAIDVAYRGQKWRAEALTRDLAQELELLAVQAEQVYLKHRNLLEQYL